MPATESAWIALAPLMLRERKMPSGISGVRAGLPGDECDEERERDRTEGQDAGRAPAVLGGRLHDRVDAEHQRARDEQGARDVRALPETEAPIAGDQARRRGAGGYPDRHVDEEDPMPVDRFRQHAAGEQADRPTGRRDERVHADRLGLLPRVGEHRDDHAEDHGRGHRAGDALYEARGDEHLLALRAAAQQRRGREQRQAGQEHVAAADQVAKAAGKQQQPAERDQVRVDDPRKARSREPEVVLDRRKRDVHDGDVENDHQHARAQHIQREPARAVVVYPGCHVGASGGSQCPVNTASKQAPLSRHDERVDFAATAPTTR
jgi:hypothetical protein